MWLQREILIDDDFSLKNNRNAFEQPYVKSVSFWHLYSEKERISHIYDLYGEFQCNKQAKSCKNTYMIWYENIKQHEPNNR